MTKIKSIPKKLADRYRVYELGIDSKQQNEAVTKHSDLYLDDGTNPHGTTKDDVGLGDVPNEDYRNRQITIDGVTYDLSADRTWSIATSVEKDYSQSFLLGGM